MNVPKEMLNGLTQEGEIVACGEVYRVFSTKGGDIEIRTPAGETVLVYEPNGNVRNKYGVVFTIEKEGPNFVMYEGPTRYRSMIGPVGLPFAMIATAHHYFANQPTKR